MLFRKTHRNTASMKRHSKKEAEKINAEVKRLAEKFLDYAKRKSTATEVENMGELFKRADIAECYLNCEQAWKNFCHKKWIYNKTIPAAFENSVRANFHLTGIKINLKNKNENGNQQNSTEAEK